MKGDNRDQSIVPLILASWKEVLGVKLFIHPLLCIGCAKLQKTHYYRYLDSFSPVNH